MEHLCRYDRVTLRLWADGHTHLVVAPRARIAVRRPRRQPRTGRRARCWLAQAAAHAVLPDLRRCATLADLLARYEATAGDLALIRSLVPDAPAPDPVNDPAWRVRDAAFYLRWQELRARPARRESGDGRRSVGRARPLAAQPGPARRRARRRRAAGRRRRPRIGQDDDPGGPHRLPGGARGVPPASVLALTFAARAARELRLRLAGLLGPAGRAVEAATFHAFGLRLLRRWGDALGWAPGPLGRLRRRRGPRAGRRGRRRPRARRGVLPAGRAGRRRRALPPQRAARPRPPALPARRRPPGARAGPRPAARRGRAGCAELAERYEALLRRRGAVDYAAMLALPLRLCDARPDALRELQEGYRHVLCDEAQDVCPTQYALLRRLAARHRNLTLVGDPRQAIYSWRGADARTHAPTGAGLPGGAHGAPGADLPRHRAPGRAGQRAGRRPALRAPPAHRQPARRGGPPARRRRRAAGGRLRRGRGRPPVRRGASAPARGGGGAVPGQAAKPTRWRWPCAGGACPTASGAAATCSPGARCGTPWPTCAWPTTRTTGPRWPVS